LFLEFQSASGDDFENEPPLLEELGINFDHIRSKTIAVLNPVSSTTVEVASDQDLAGPLAFCLLLGASLLLNGRVSSFCELLNFMFYFRCILATFMELECLAVWECTLY
jgi:hypothetical protein